MLAKNIIITGCNRGIGLEFVKQFLSLPEPPKNLIATCRNAANAQELCSLKEKHPQLHVLELDMKDCSGYSTFVDKVKEIFGNEGLNLLVNNAGMMERVQPGQLNVPLEQLEASVMSDVLITNTVGPLMLIKAFLPLLKQSGSCDSDSSHLKGTVVNLSSILASIGGYTGFPDIYAYRASKAALNMINKSLAIEYEKDKCLFVLIHPGWVQTEMGTTKGLITTKESVSDMIKVFQNLQSKDNGQFFSHDGTTIPW